MIRRARHRALGVGPPTEESGAYEPRADARAKRRRVGRRGRAPAAIAVAGALVLGLGAGSAYGYFTASGSGTGSASTGTLLPVVGAQGTPMTRLLPGGTADVAVLVTNPNAFAVTVVTAEAPGPVTVDPGHSGCTASPVTFTPPGNLPLTIGPGTTSLTLNGAASMSASAPNACQGASFSIPLTLTVRSG